jgi:peroxiredoxin
MGWLGELASHKADLDAVGAQVIAIAVDPPDKLAQLARRFPELTMAADDAALSVTHAWTDTPAGADYPTPGTYVVGAGGTIRFSFPAQPGRDWPAWDQVAAAL